MDENDEYAELFRKLPRGESSGSSWQDVASEFEALGKTIGDALFSAFQRLDGETDLTRLRESLQYAIHTLNRAVDGSPETAQARDQLVSLASSIRAAAQQAGDEVRPELLAMLRQANAELRRRAHLDD